MSSTTNLMSGCLDVIVIQQPDGSLRSTPFQIVFSYFATAGIKHKEVDIEINGTKTDVKMSLNKEGRALFEKKFIRNNKNIFDSSDCSSEEDTSERDKSSERSASPKRSFVESSSKFNAQIAKLSAKNEPAPFWQFLWQTKRSDQPQELSNSIVKKEQQQSLLEKIEQQDYEGEETSDDPDFIMSLCGDYLQKHQNLSPREIIKAFYSQKVKQKDFMKDPMSFINNQNLVVKIKESIYTWEIGLSILLAKYAFNVHMNPIQINEMVEKKKNQGWLRFLSNQKRKFVIETDNYEAKADTSNDQKTPVVPNEQITTKMVRVPPSDLLKQLGLQKGVNHAKFSIEGTATPLSCRIYLWDYKTKIVVSDIDGTITTSDVFGQLMHVFKEKYIHRDVVKLYQHFKLNGYEIVYLTARAISQYQQTQEFLFEFLHEDDTYMPLGPVFTSPDGLFLSFKREVIDKQPDFLKTQILTVIKECFPMTVNPYFCGFGNKTTDAAAYNKLIKPERIYIISEKSDIYVPSKKEFKSTYTELLEKFEGFFNSSGDEVRSKSSTEPDIQMFSPLQVIKQSSMPELSMELLPELVTESVSFDAVKESVPDLSLQHPPEVFSEINDKQQKQKQKVKQKETEREKDEEEGEGEEKDKEKGAEKSPTGEDDIVS